MRISVDKEDRAYHPKAADGEVRIFLDDKELKFVVTADEDQGFVTRCCTDSDGRFLTENGKLKKETLWGSVRIVLPFDFYRSAR